jgi:hypothetical protein
MQFSGRVPASVCEDLGLSSSTVTGERRTRKRRRLGTGGL